MYDGMVRIRPATKNDITSILDLLYELDRPKPKTKSEQTAFEGKITQYIKQKQLFLAIHDSKPVGLVSVMLVPKLNHAKPELYIPDLVVSSHHRRAGIGKALINHCIMMAKKKKCFRIRLESGNKRVVAHKFYDSLGFEQYAKTYRLEL